MHPIKRLTHLTKARHRPSLLSKPSLLLHKVCHRLLYFKNYQWWIYKEAVIILSINQFQSWRHPIGKPSWSKHDPNYLFQSKARDCLETSKTPNLADLHLSTLFLTDSLPLFRNKILPIAFFLSPSTSLMMKGKRKALHWHLEQYRQKLYLGWRICWTCCNKTQLS